MNNVFTSMLQVSAAMSQVGIAKNRENKMQGFSFRGIDDYLNALSPELVKASLLVLPSYKDVVVTQAGVTSKGTAINNVRLTGVFKLVCAEDGSSTEIVTIGEGQDSADKAVNKAMSAAYKYMAAQAFCIPLIGTDSEESEPHEKAKIELKPLTDSRFESAIENVHKKTYSLADLRSKFALTDGQIKKLDSIFGADNAAN